MRMMNERDEQYSYFGDIGVSCISNRLCSLYYLSFACRQSSGV